MTILEEHSSLFFRTKFRLLESDKQRSTIKYYAEWIYEQNDPCTLTGSVTCPSHNNRKVKFDDNWCILYDCSDEKPFFITFYMDRFNSPSP